MKAKEFIPASKPRNFVAKNQKTAGAGAHKDKKKAEKQGDVKHKGKQFDENHVDEISDQGLNNYRRQAHYAVQGHKFGSKKDEPNAADIIAKREKGMQRAGDKIVARKKAEDDKRVADLVARLPELKAEYEKMRAEYKSLGGSDWQYADREQNLSDRERKARSMEGPMNNLWRQISAAEKAQKQEGFSEGQDERSQNRLWAQITDYEKRAKATSNDIKKQHYLKMASDLRGKLKTSDVDESTVTEYETHRYTDDQGNEWEVNDEGDKTLIRRAGGGRSSYGRGSYRPTPTYNKPKGMYFYNVPAGQESDARSAGLRQSKSGKWYDTTSNFSAEKLFGKGRYWEPKN
jgi:hypothetical protein